MQYSCIPVVIWLWSCIVSLLAIAKKSKSRFYPLHSRCVLSFLSLYLSLSLSLSLSVSLSLSLSLSLCFTLSLYFSLSIYLYLSICLSLSRSLLLLYCFLSACFPFSRSLPVLYCSLSLRVSLALSSYFLLSLLTLSFYVPFRFLFFLPLSFSHSTQTNKFMAYRCTSSSYTDDSTKGIMTILLFFQVAFKTSWIEAFFPSWKLNKNVFPVSNKQYAFTTQATDLVSNIPSAILTGTLSDPLTRI